VIQPLGQFYRGVDLFSGTTIMGDGRVAMIVDLAGTVRSLDLDRGDRAPSFPPTSRPPASSSSSVLF
jgi:two-component system chemotaxis sensor kinase CheA